MEGYVRKQSDWTWAHTFLVGQFIIQIALLFPQFGAMRLPFRIAAFALSLFLFVWLRGKGPKHPSSGVAKFILFIVVSMLLLHPSENNFMSMLAQCGLYFAVLGPLFWARRLKFTEKNFEKLIFILWAFHTLSVIFGVLQVYFPGRFQPYLAQGIQQSQWEGENLLITLASGAQVYRPMGLTDLPGGAATSAIYAMLFSLCFFALRRNKLMTLICVGIAALSLFCIYLSQVRMALVSVSVCLIVFVVSLAKAGKFGRATLIGVGIVILFITVFNWAITVGGEDTLQRIYSLFLGKPQEVYYENRGIFLEDTVANLLPKYPLGAGLGRWGMVSQYFGDKSRVLWAEIQWTGWLFDGGLLLIAAYCLALYFAFLASWKIAGNRRLGDFRVWGALFFAYNIGALSATFSSPNFNTQAGLEFWLLNTALFTAAQGIIKKEEEPLNAQA